MQYMTRVKQKRVQDRYRIGETGEEQRDQEGERDSPRVWNRGILDRERLVEFTEWETALMDSGRPQSSNHSDDNGGPAELHEDQNTAWCLRTSKQTDPTLSPSISARGKHLPSIKVLIDSDMRLSFTMNGRCCHSIRSTHRITNKYSIHPPSPFLWCRAQAAEC